MKYRVITNMSFSEMFNYFIGPRLYRIYRCEDSPARQYVANSVEYYSDNVIKLLSIFRSLAIYSSPIIITYLYKRGYLFTETNHFYVNYSLIRIGITISFAFFGAFITRGLGRLANNDYRSFMNVLRDSGQSADTRAMLSKYEFDFAWSPVDYRWYESALNESKKAPALLESGKQSKRVTVFDSMKKLPCDVFSYIVVHTFGRRMLYPGSVSFLQSALSSALLEGRSNLIDKYNAFRYKLLARDGNHIDCIFVDKRRDNTSQGKTLVIGCEGNAGFYEIGTINTPLYAGYSVLGWNHPGFGGSTGLPFPINDINAIDAVINFAVDKLGFKIEDIILFAWSIGGFPASWGAMQYPNIKGLILDASFDDVLPLAEAKMPQTWKPLVRNTIRTYFNLNNSAYLNLYNGPILLIRRLRDEILITNDSESLKTNRCNDLLIKLLQNRFPKLMSVENVSSTLKQWIITDINGQSLLNAKYAVNEELCLAQLISYAESNGFHYPLNIGEDESMTVEDKIKLILFLAQKHMKDFDSTHCTPLPSAYIQQPFDLISYQNHVKSNYKL